MVWKLSFMLILLANLNLADLLTTKLGVANGCVEMNPIAANLLNLGAFEVYKLSATLIVCGLSIAFVILRDVINEAIRNSRIARVAWRLSNLLVAVAVISYTAVVVNNTLVLITSLGIEAIPWKWSI